MAQIFRILIAYPAFFLLQKVIKRFSLFVGLVVFICVTIFSGKYINNFSLNLLEAPKENRRSFVDYLLFHVEQDYKKIIHILKKLLHKETEH